MAGLQIQVLGGFSVWAEGQPIKAFATQKVRALLAYLVLRPGQAHARPAMATLFWPDAEPSRAAQNLRQSLTFLRKGLAKHRAETALTIDRQTVRFSHLNVCTVDVLQLAEALHLATIESRMQAVTLYQGDLLAGFHLKDAPEFDTWLVAERERWQTAVLQAVDQLSAHFQAQGEYNTARRYLQKALGIDPWHEQAHRDLMRLLALAGDPTGALAQYKKCREALLTGLGVEPLPETQALAAHIRAGTLPLPKERPTTLPLQFTGRGREHAQLVALFHQRRESPHLILLSGSWGIGKSRLMQEFSVYAASHNALLLCGRCLAFGVPVPYQPFVSALRAGLPAVREPLAPIWQAELARLLPELGTATVETDETARQRLFTSVAAFWETLGTPGQPLLLLLDDLQWLDSASADLLQFLLYYAPPRLLIIGTYRSDEMSGTDLITQLRRKVSRDGLVSSLKLNPLTEVDVQTMAISLVSAEQADELTAYLWRESRGNPFILTELLYELTVTYDLRAVPWKLPRFWANKLQKLTERVRDVVLDLGQRLPTVSQSVLSIAAVIGPEFDLELLTAVHPTPRLTEYLAQWQQYGLVYPEKTGFIFAHDKIQAVLLAALPEEDKKAWHTAVAKALSQLQPTASSKLAHHFFLGTEPTQALPFLLIAAQKAFQALAFAEVVALCSQALSLQPGTPHLTRDLLQLRQRAYQFLGKTEAEGEDALALFKLAQATGDGQQLAEAAQRLSRFYYLRGRAAEARQAVEEVLQVARESGKVETAVRILDMLAMLFRETEAGQTEAMRWLDEALILARNVADLRMEGLLLSDTAVILSEKGEWGAALHQAATSLHLLKQAQAHSYLPHALYIQGGLLRAVGQYALAAPALEEALALCRTHQMGTYLIQILLEQGELALIEHRLLTAKEVFIEAHHLAEQEARPLILARTLAGLGQVAYQNSDFMESRQQLEQALALCPEDKANLQVSIQATLVLTLLGLDKPGLALDISTAAVTAVAAGKYIFTHKPHVFWSQARALQEAGEAHQARSWLQKAAALLRIEAATLPVEWQNTFLTNIPLHRMIMQWARNNK